MAQNLLLWDEITNRPKRSTIPQTTVVKTDASATFSSGVNLVLTGGGEVTGLPATPTGATAAASKAYVDAAIDGATTAEVYTYAHTSGTITTTTANTLTEVHSFSIPVGTWLASGVYTVKIATTNASFSGQMTAAQVLLTDSSGTIKSRAAAGFRLEIDTFAAESYYTLNFNMLLTVASEDTYKIQLVCNQSTAAGEASILPEGTNFGGGVGEAVKSIAHTVLIKQGVGGGGGGGGGGGSLDPWVVKTANYTAASGERIAADTSGGAFTVTLPAGPTVGDEVRIMDGGGTFSTSNLTIARNGSNIAGLASDFVADSDNLDLTFVYVSASRGWAPVN